MSRASRDRGERAPANRRPVVLDSGGRFRPARAALGARGAVAPHRDEEPIRFGSAQGRWVLAATVLGSGIAFLDGTVVNVALPAISGDLGTSVGGLQWIVNAYLVTLSALLLLGGSLGDRFGRRRVFVIGLTGFSVASVLCGLAPSSELLIAARALQGVGGALLIPGSLAIIAATFDPEDRGKAIGAWSGLAGVASSIGPFVGGWLIDAASWRLVFFINVPLAAVAVAIAARHVPETRSSAAATPDVLGSLLATAGFGAASFALIERRGGPSMAAGLIGVLALAAFIVVQRRAANPMVPLRIFESRQFTGANLVTLAVYAGLGGGLFLTVLQLQTTLGYSALEAGAALVPFTILMLLLSPAAGELGQRIGPRLPMSLGPIVAAGGLLLLAGVTAGDTYVRSVLPGIVVFGLGMALLVAPLTAAVLGGVCDDLAGIASGINNAVARLGGLVAVAALPSLAGIAGHDALTDSLDAGFATAVRIAAGVTALGGVVALVMVRQGTALSVVAHPSVDHACHDPELGHPERAPSDHQAERAPSVRGQRQQAGL